MTYDQKLDRINWRFANGEIDGPEYLAQVAALKREMLDKALNQLDNERDEAKIFKRERDIERSK